MEPIENKATAQKQPMSKAKKATWAGVFAVLIPVLIAIITSLDGKAIGENLNAKLTGKPVVVAMPLDASVSSNKQKKAPASLDPLAEVLETILELEEGIEENKESFLQNKKALDLLLQLFHKLEKKIDKLQESVQDTRERTAHIEGKLEGIR